ncbi:MAG: hypothetical protein HY900_00990 [Deltaproteobacteria bacterium]|nr:hypothetical protein [Deltaproteobacteria bacterium]
MRIEALGAWIAVLALAGAAPGAGYGPESFSAAERKWQPIPSGHTPGKDNGPGAGAHNSGEDCGLCHRPGGRAGDYDFTIAGTLYEDRAGRRPLAGGEVVLQDLAGNVISLTSNASGNFWTTAPLAGNPFAVASHWGKTQTLYSEKGPADVASDSRTWLYKAWVRNGEQVVKMVTIAPVGGSTDPTSRMSCNMHHGALGTRGGLWVSRRSTLSAYPAADLSFRRHVLPILRQKCVPCHIPGETMTRLVTRTDLDTPSTSLDYSRGLDLTSYGGSTVGKFAKRGPGALGAGHTADPDASPLLATTRLNAAQPHAGGAFWADQDADYRAIRQWIAEGARDN